MGRKKMTEKAEKKDALTTSRLAGDGSQSREESLLAPRVAGTNLFSGMCPECKYSIKVETDAKIRITEVKGFCNGCGSILVLQKEKQKGDLLRRRDAGQTTLG